MNEHQAGHEETRAEQLDRNYRELLNELRVALPGVQVLFAFLLAVPFSARFADATAFQEKLFLGVLLCTAFSAALLIAPTMLHRLLFRRRMKDQIVNDANRLAIAGVTLLAVAMTGAILLITDVIFGTAMALIAAGATALAFLLLWWLLPLTRRVKN